MGGNIYKCPSCGAEFRRESDLNKIKSYCDKAGKEVYLKRVGSENNKIKEV